MHFSGLLNEVFAHRSIGVDKRLHSTLLEASHTLCECRQLSIAGLARQLRSSAGVKHVIKRIDRLFGNRRLHERREQYYRVMLQRLVNRHAPVLLIVDWSGLSRCGRYHFLRASVPVGGRALTVWEGAYLERDYASARAHRECVQALKRLLPADCRPIVLSDAGFRNPWFKLVAKQRWHYIGRVRHQTYCRRLDSDEWVCAKHYYGQAKGRACALFEGFLAKANPLRGHFYLYRNPRKGRSKRNLRGQKIQSSVSLKHAKGAREPWLLFSSLSTQHYRAATIVSMYAKRMQIEESFRDLKNTRNGFSLRHCRSASVARLNIALLIAAIATFALWLLGLIARCLQAHRLFQANTIRHRTVLSTFTIGWQSFKRQLRFKRQHLRDAISLVQQHAQLDFVA
jgi:hypothetical protein